MSASPRAVRVVLTATPGGGVRVRERWAWVRRLLGLDVAATFVPRSGYAQHLLARMRGRGRTVMRAEVYDDLGVINLEPPA